ncbi:signal peptidase II [Clostridium sediminicola]|uniref:signal peptidase II n=1 Tax=Clostridium sediminicola TaxID=3114879 RepID=UPI0031F1FF76
MELVIIIIGLLLDRITKFWAINSLKGNEGIVVIKNLFAFEYLENRGAAFGILQNKLNFLAIITFIVLIGMIYYRLKYKPKTKIMKVSLALIISGAIGNLIDRIWIKYVVDFILVHYKEVYYFPTFNVADILVVVGTFLFALCIIKEWE